MISLRHRGNRRAAEVKYTPKCSQWESPAVRASLSAAARMSFRVFMFSVTRNISYNIVLRSCVHIYAFSRIYYYYYDCSDRFGLSDRNWYISCKSRTSCHHRIICCKYGYTVEHGEAQRHTDEWVSSSPDGPCNRHRHNTAKGETHRDWLEYSRINQEMKQSSIGGGMWDAFI